MAQDPKQAVRRLLELLNAGRLNELEEVLSSGRKRLAPEGARKMRRFFSKLRAALPDCSIAEQALVAEGDHVALLGVIEGTHTGKLLRLQPTGRSLKVRTMNIWRLVDGRLSEPRGSIDLLSLALQLGESTAGAVASDAFEPVHPNLGDEHITDGIKEVARRFHESASSEAEAGQIVSLMSRNYTDHTAVTFEGREPGPAGRLQALELVRTAFPDLVRTVDLQIAEGDLVVTAVTDTGRHTGQYLKAAPTGKSVRMQGINLDRVSDGLLSESWHVEDLASLARQLGLFKNQGSTKV